MRDFTTRLQFAYVSTAAIIGILIILAQIVIQLTLAQEVSTRGLASTMALQELRTQALFRNALLAILPDSEQAKMNALGVKPIDALTKNLADIEATNKILIGPDVPTSISARMQGLQKNFDLMDKAGHQVLVDLKAGDKKGAGVQVGVLFPPEQVYLIGTYNAYLDLTSEADAQVQRIQVIEICICLGSIGVLLYEAFFVIRPAIKDMRTILDAPKIKTEST